jgi:hypothetical protein
MKQPWSRAVLLFLVAYALLGVYGAASVFWRTPGTIGLATDYGATVRAISPGGPAARAGIVAGDRIRLADTPFADRRYLAGPGTSLPVGANINVALTHAGENRDVRLTAVPDVMPVAARAALSFLCIASLVFIFVGAALIVLRPSPATWGFGLYCLLALPAASYPFPAPAAGMALAATAVYDVLQNFGVVGLLLFALEFPRPFDVPWRDRVRGALPALFAVLALMTLYPDVANQLLARGAQFENRVLQVAFGAAFAGAMLILCDTYRRIARDERERVRWVLLGFGCGLLGSYIGNTLIFSTLIAAAPPAWLAMSLTTLNVLLPLTVAHAVVRHRVLDIRIVVERTLVFAAMTTILAGIFALLDYLFGTLLEDFRLSRYIAAAISLALAFAFKWLEERATRTIEAVFLPNRRDGQPEESEARRLREENERLRATVEDLTARLDELRVKET